MCQVYIIGKIQQLGGLEVGAVPDGAGKVVEIIMAVRFNVQISVSVNDGILVSTR